MGDGSGTQYMPKKVKLNLYTTVHRVPLAVVLICGWNIVVYSFKQKRSSMKVSIIVPFASLSKEQKGHLNTFEETNYDRVVLSTIEAIRNINKVLKSVDKQIILVDNNHNFPNITLPNLNIIKGWQGYNEEEFTNIPEYTKYNINVINN